ncbi:thioredoxin [Gloeothece verrucosa]|uniref:Thioredoxin n=1 Tax=Gloeothece verrucosa (strain PCC 7822) TaxID=497965 RepID=E0U5Q8_GLOV7|nr:thioredoxin [Gloeothece verrucosa]ADN15899.1 thioredoxin [Gloeothece verrucosa PCC 7822]
MTVKKQYNSFQELLESSDLPVLVDFNATWCGPCKMMGPVLDQVSAFLKNRLLIVKIDTDKYPGLASRYHIHSLPTLILFKNGQPVERMEGILQAKPLIQHLQTFL